MKRLHNRAFKGLEIRQTAEGDSSGLTTIRGFGLKWDETINYGGFFRERIERGAFADTLRTNDVKLMIGHAYDGLPLASKDTGTMDVIETKEGLEFEARIDESDPEAASLATKIRAGLADSMSIGFIEGKTEIVTGKKKDDGSRELDLRIIKEVENLREISVVTWPAYESSSVEARRLLEPDISGIEAARKEDEAEQFEFERARAELSARACGIIVGVGGRIGGAPKGDSYHDKAGTI